MRPLRVLSALVLLAALFGWTPAVQAQSVAGGVHKALDITLFFDEPLLDGDGNFIGHMSAMFGFSSRSGVDLSVPDATSTVSGWGSLGVFNFQDSNGSFSRDFPVQDLGPTALVSGPIANTVTIRTTMYTDPQAQTGAHTFDFTLARPQSMFIAHPDTHNPGVNVFVDGGSAEAKATTQIGVVRSGYTISGVVADETIIGGPNGCGGSCAYTFANVFDGVVADPVLTIP